MCFGRDEATPTMPLVGPLPVCVPWAVVVAVSARADRCVPLVLTEARQESGFAGAVTPTTPLVGAAAVGGRTAGRDETTPTIALVGPSPVCARHAFRGRR